MWSGGYFVPERTFCAIPSEDHQAYHLFSRRIIKHVDDEVQAHVSMFIRDKNDEYDQMTQEASNLVVRWFADDSGVEDNSMFLETSSESAEQPVTTTPEGQKVPKVNKIIGSPDSAQEDLAEVEVDGIKILDESPIDITAAAAAVPLPDDDEDTSLVADTSEARNTTYMRYLMGIAQHAGTGVKSYVPTKMPEIPSGPSFKSFVPRSMPQMPQMPSIPRPAVGIFSKKQPKDANCPDEPSTGEVSTPNPELQQSDGNETSTAANALNQSHQEPSNQQQSPLTAS
ncbi:putative calcium-dependent secretion activator 1 [Rosellinia necatrix]|uniref:Putative calcium-dependent secretion activator 1 n=1 Tax=Rosellinia necatrix TaxID=77044 RepID=A0A1S8A826_ROSNE|nr:putative calcium-dependent secretion activator 1 [Rosellinia necatrix]